MIHKPSVLDPASVAKKHVVLCVDDDALVLSSLRRLLRGEPYDLVTVDSPFQALKEVETTSVSLVLVDQRMPEMCGSDLAERIRQISPDTHRVMLTAYPGNVFVHHGLSDSVQWLMGKPWNDEALKLTLRHLLHNSEQRREQSELRRTIRNLVRDVERRRVEEREDGTSEFDIGGESG